MISTIVILAVVGILAILFEMVLPGGVLGIAGALCLIAVVVLSFVEFGPVWGLITFGALTAFGVFMTWIWMKFFHRLPFTRKLILKGNVGNDVELEARQQIVGQTGVALTDIRPSGRARIGDQKLDVIAESGIINKGSSIEVTDTRGPSIFVKISDQTGSDR